MRRTVWAAAAVLGVACPAAADDAASVRVTARVARACAATLGGGGTIEAYCNDPKGYRLVLEHAPASGAVFAYRGREVRARPDGRTPLYAARTAEGGRHELRLVQGDAALLRGARVRVEPR
ncbi:MAG: hypothetical protein KDG89_14165 [Geminicoccaceae bacterium]|nr:hypothetical protein [Geminicoccaceae bacterium]